MPIIRINRREVEVDEGTTIMQAADKLGIHIPRYCYHPGLSIAGCCRICAVEVEDSPKLLMACATPVNDGMVVRTDTERVKNAQKAVEEFLLLNHPLDCPVCDQAGECWLQDYSYDYGFAESRFREPKIKQRKKDVGKNLILYADRCIMCTRCVRFAREISGYDQVGVFGRGCHTEIDVFPGFRIDDNLSGNIADICPVGAFLFKDFLFKRRVWELASAKSICPACSTGCNVSLHHAEGQIQRLLPRYNPSVNGHWMCDIGRLDYKFVGSSDRLKHPMIRVDEMLEELTWDETIDHASSRLKKLVSRYGSDALGFVISSDAANEEAFALAKLAAAIGAAQTLRLLPGARAKEERFLNGFTIESDRSPNERGVLDMMRTFLSADEEKRVRDLDSLVGARAFYILCGPHSDPEAIEKLADMASSADLSIVQAILPSALTEAATIVFPGAAYAEKDGTFTNSARIVQRINPAFNPPEEAGHDLQIIIEFAKAMGADLSFENFTAAGDEIASRVSGYVGPEQMSDTGWPLPSHKRPAFGKGRQP